MNKWALKELNLPSPPHLFFDNGFTDRREEQSPCLGEGREATQIPYPSSFSTPSKSGTGEI